MPKIGLQNRKGELQKLNDNSLQDLQISIIPRSMLLSR